MENSKETELNTNKDKETKPDDKAGFYLRNFLKIYDPESGQIAVETTQ